MDSLLEQAVVESPFRRELDCIRAALWTNTAAVLVGSGFSRNANPQMPTWDSWAKELVNVMDVSAYVRENAKAQDVPWLAGAYAKRHSPPEMRALLLRTMNELHMLRSELHEQLVCLPWTDIFTTNYDEFLEQAAQRARNARNLPRACSVIVEPSDICLSRRSDALRIIKLHGSLRSKTQCVLTEEQYRTYSESHAPFVNTVRQTLLENHLCLIGYSATDPDFLEWVGWVRDKLRGESLKIYWLTKGRVTEDEKCIHKQRGITCISLNCFDVQSNFEKWAEGSDDRGGYEEPAGNDAYYEMYSNFFRWLYNYEKNVGATDVSAGSPNAGGGCRESGETGPQLVGIPHQGQGSPEPVESWEYTRIGAGIRIYEGGLPWEKILELSEEMRKARESYPGWLLPSMSVLRQLWNQNVEVSHFVRQLGEMRTTVVVCQLLAPLREVCWLMDMAGLPPFNNIHAVLEDILTAALPAIIKASKEPEDHQQVSLHASQWIACALLLMHWCRQERDDALFESIIRKLKQVLRILPDAEAAASIEYQRILQRLECFDHKGALRLLRGWTLLPTTVSNIWFIRKGMLLGELGDVRQGYALIKDQYDILLPQVTKAHCPPVLLSTARLAAESLRLFSFLAENNWFPPHEKRRNDYADIPKVFEDDLPALGKTEPDGIATLESLQSDVKAVLAKAQIVPSKILFETGRRDTSIHFHSGLWPGFREAFQCDRAMELLGRTPYLGHASFSIASWLEIAQLLFYLQRGINGQSLRILLRAAPQNTFEATEDIFLQYYLVRLEEDGVLTLVMQLRQGLQHILDKKTKHSRDERYARFGLELLSRLCVRVRQPEMQQTLLDQALAWMKQGPAWERVGAFKELSLFCHRIVESVSYALLQHNLVNILSSPVLVGFRSLQDGHSSFSFSRAQDIITALPHDFQTVKASVDLRALATTLWSELRGYEDAQGVEALENKWGPDLREAILSRYYWRLLWMLRHELIDAETKNNMAAFVWTEYALQGLPRLPGMRIFAILEWPAPAHIDVAERYKSILLQQSIPPADIVDADGRRAYPSGYTSPLNEFLRIGVAHRKKLCLTYEDKLQILTRCFNSKFQEEDTRKHIREAVHNPLISLTWILSYVFGAELGTFEKDAPWLSAWMKELIIYNERIGAGCQRLKVLNLLFDTSPRYAKNLALELEEDICSNDKDRQLEAGFAVLLWRAEIALCAKLGNASMIPCPPALCQAALRGFWLMDEQRAAALAGVLKEQFEHYTLTLDDHELCILLRALQNKLRTLSYTERAKESLPQWGYYTREWVRYKENLELLPEQRLAVGEMIASLCKATPPLRSMEVIQQFLSEMTDDPLADLRRLAESASVPTDAMSLKEG